MDDKNQCCKCLKRHLDRTNTRIKIINSESEVQAVCEQLNLSNVTIGSKLCDKCRKLVFFGTQTTLTVPADQPSTSIEDDRQPTSSESSTEPLFSSESSGNRFEITLKPPVEKSPTIELTLPRTVTTHKYCCVCKGNVNLTTVPLEARLQCFNKTKIFIPRENRVCSEHLIKKRFFEDDLQLIQIYSNTSFLSAEEICQFINQMSTSVPQSFLDKIKTADLSEKQLLSFTSLKFDQLESLRPLLISMRNSSSRDVMQALVICLFKLRTGSSNNFISSVFDIDNEIKISDFCESVINSFERDVLPKYFGVDSVVRENLIENHTSIYAKKLFNITNQLLLVFDGTYIHHQKSKNNDYQRKSYSGHKKKPLCKPFTICTTDGFVVDVPGPFLATENDASIMQKVMDDPNGIRKIMRKGDICIVDRGFRDVVPYLENLGFKVLMPALKGKRPNLTASESNQSRYVTKLRWVVEAVHGIIGRKYKLLSQQLDNKLLPRVGSYCKIACFLNNRFGKRLNSDDKDPALQDAIINRMLESNQSENTLAQEVSAARWSRRSTTMAKVTSQDIDDFPELSERDLKIFFTGTYQLGQSVCYLAELLDETDNINLEYVKLRPNIIKVQIRSRHISRKSYKSYVEYEPNSTGYSGILRYCCDCANGLRMVGCCSHIATIVYYLSNARYKSKIIRPAKILSEIFADTDIDPVIEEDSDED